MRTVTRVLIVAALAFASGCAQTDWIDRTLVTVDVTGVWFGSTGQGSSFSGLLLQLEQQGSKVKGSMRMQGGGAPGGRALIPGQAKYSSKVQWLAMCSLSKIRVDLSKLKRPWLETR